MNSLQTIIEQAWETELCYKKRQQQKPLEVIELLDAGKLSCWTKETMGKRMG
jgi:hypothetical protein